MDFTEQQILEAILLVGWAKFANVVAFGSEPCRTLKPKNRRRIGKGSSRQPGEPGTSGRLIPPCPRLSTRVALMGRKVIVQLLVDLLIGS